MLAHNGEVMLLNYEDLKDIRCLDLYWSVREAASVPSRWTCMRVVTATGDVPLAVFAVDALPLGEVYQWGLGNGANIHEDVEA